jgi:hypothetical protein
MVKGSLLLTVLLSSLAVACTVGAPAGQDLLAPSTASSTQPKPTPTPAPTPLPCAEDVVACGPDERTYATVTECTSAGEELCRRVAIECGASAVFCGSSPENECDAYPSCDAGDRQVISCGASATCYQRSLCGSTITCQEPDVNCKALPTCDSGDPEITNLSDCKLATSDCYSRTTCGVTIWCNNTN